MAPIGGRRTAAANENLPALGREFVIRNRKDIVCFVVMVIGLSGRVSVPPVCSMFVDLQYGQAVAAGRDIPQTYGTGPKDSFIVFFLFLNCILFDVTLKEYVLDKICRRLHLSKSKNSKFNESGKLIVFNSISLVWALYIIMKEHLLADLSSLWNGYPNSALSFSTKFFYIIQFAYWAHILPELYFQKVKKEEMFNKVKYSVLYLAFISSVYITNFHHIGVVVLMLHYISGFINHTVKLIDIIEKNEDSNIVQLAQNVYHSLFFSVQLLILIISQTAIWLGLNNLKNTGELQDFKIPMFKLLCSICALATQAWIAYEFFSELSTSSEKLYITTLLGLFKSKLKAAKNDNAIKKLQNTSMFNKLSETEQKIKKVQKTEMKKAAKAAKNASKIAQKANNFLQCGVSRVNKLPGKPKHISNLSVKFQNI